MDKKKMINGLLILGGIVFSGYELYKGVKGKEPTKYSLEWIKGLSDSDWKTEREIVRQRYCSPELSVDIRMWNKRILDLFDKVKSDRDWAGQTPQGPAFHREHGWYL